MKNKIILLNINKLKSHEAINKKRLTKLIKKIKKDGYLKNPVVVDNKYFIVLDGHHRMSALKQLKIKKIPVFIVNYFNKSVKVYLRRKKLLMRIIKNQIIRMAINNKVFPFKTTRHYIKNRPRNINIKLKELI